MGDKDIVDNFFNSHVREHGMNEGNGVDSFYCLCHHKPPGHGFYDDNASTVSVCPAKSAPLNQKIKMFKKNGRNGSNNLAKIFLTSKPNAKPLSLIRIQGESRWKAKH
jgi:hypothetical protein